VWSLTAGAAPTKEISASENYCVCSAGERERSALIQPLADGSTMNAAAQYDSLLCGSLPFDSRISCNILNGVA